jgi:enamine deaminase RidA (YjgF/YER057c/UK114 family)
MRFPRGTIAAIACGLVASSLLPGQKRNKKEEETQVLQLPKELPNAVAGNTRRLTFHTTPLTAKGLLSSQVREALKALQRETGGETVLKIRAFVAGSADLRRVRDLVSQSFAGRKQPLPALALIRSGGLPLEGAQIELEAVAESKKDVNPYGLAFVAPVVATADDPLGPVPPLTEKSLAGLRGTLAAAGLEASDVARVTCFFSSLANLAASRGLVETEYPRAALDFVQTQRAPGQALAACEAVARLRAAPSEPLSFSKAGNGASLAAFVSAPQVVLTGNQDSFGYQEQAARLAFERITKTLQQAGASPASVAYAHYYPLSPGLASQIRKVRTEFFTQNPPETLLIFEGLPSMDAGFGVEVVAVKGPETADGPPAARGALK